MEAAINGGLPFRRALLCHHLCRNDLKGECHCGYQGEDRVDSRGVPEAFRAEESRYHNVVGEVDGSRQARARKQYNASRDNARLQRFRLMDQTIHRILESGSP
jgi:hypothetical protein